jgi:hypothetical protein
MLRTATVDMIDFQEFGGIFAAARTDRTAISDENLGT